MRATLFGVLLAVGCTAGPDDTSAQAPTIAILSPLDGTIVCGSPLIVDLDVQNFVLVDPATEDTTPGHGHVDMFLNGQAVDMQPAEHMLVPNVEDGFYFAFEQNGEWAGSDVNLFMFMTVVNREGLADIFFRRDAEGNTVGLRFE